MVPRYPRWSVYLADLEPVKGREQGDKRPVVIISRTEHNGMEMVTVLPLTDGGKKGRPAKPFEVVLPFGLIESGIQSWVLPRQVRALSTDRLMKHIGSLDDADSQRNVEDALLDHLDLFEE